MDDPEVRAILRNLVLPPTGPLLLAIAGLIAAGATRFRKIGFACTISGLAVLWLLSTPIVSGLLVRSVEAYPALDVSAPIGAHAVVILGGGTQHETAEYQGSAPKPLTLQRLAYGVRIARITGLPVLVTGGDREGATLAEFMRRDFQLEPRWVEASARNTHENAKYSAAMLRSAGVDEIILVTSALHMRRAVAEFERYGLSVAPAPVGLTSRGRTHTWSDLVPGMAALRDSHYALYELLGELVSAVRR